MYPHERALPSREVEYGGSYQCTVQRLEGVQSVLVQLSELKRFTFAEFLVSRYDHARDVAHKATEYNA